MSLRSIVTLPLAVKQNRIITHMELLQPTIKEYSEALKHNVVVKCKREGFSLEETNRRYRTEVGVVMQLIKISVDVRFVK